MKEIIIVTNSSGISVEFMDGPEPDAGPGNIKSNTKRFTNLAEAMVEVMEFLSPNQLHAVSAYLELKAEQDEKNAFRAIYGG